MQPCRMTCPFHPKCYFPLHIAWNSFPGHAINSTSCPKPCWCKKFQAAYPRSYIRMAEQVSLLPNAKYYV